MFKYILILCVTACFAEAAQLRMKFSGRNLPDTDLLTNIDPYLRVHMISAGRSGRQLLGTTKHFNDVTNPNWAKVFTVNHLPGTKQTLLIELFDKEDGADEFVSDVTLDLDSYKRKGENVVLPLKKGSLVVKRA